MMITMLFYLDFLQKFFVKNYKQNLRHQVVEAEAIQKLPLLHPCFEP